MEDRSIGKLYAVFGLANLQEERQVSLGKVKVPPTGQHAVNHVNEGKWEAAGSAPL